MTRLRVAVLAIVVVAVSAAPARAGDYIVVLKDSASEPAVAADHAKKGAKVFQHYKHALKGYAATLSDSQLAAVRTDSRVRFIAPDTRVQAAAVSCTDPDRPPLSEAQCLPNGVARIDGEVSSTRSGDGNGSVNVNVAVLDTGIELAGPELNVVGGKNCSSAGSSAGKSFDDPNGHGTAVAGIVGAKDNALGVVGIAPGARLWAVRVLNKHGFANRSDIICGIDFVTATRGDSDPSNDIHVANMSLSGGGTDDGNCGLTKKDPEHVAICNSVQAGVVYTASAGNAAQDLRLEVPAAYDEVLTATSMTDYDGVSGGTGEPAPRCATGLIGDEGADDSATGFSNFATLSADRAHTVAAPGVCVVSSAPAAICLEPPSLTPPCGSIGSGTSASAPHVAGTVALCIHSGACAGLTAPQIVQKIVNDAQAYNQANPGYGYQGDPLRPIPGKHYGWLIRAGLY